MHLRKAGKRLLLVSLVALIVGWKPIPENETRNNIPEPASRGMGGEIYIRYLPDGTKCAVLNGIRKGGLDCDWGGESKKRIEREMEERNERNNENRRERY